MKKEHENKQKDGYEKLTVCTLQFLSSEYDIRLHEEESLETLANVDSDWADVISSGESPATDSWESDGCYQKATGDDRAQYPPVR